MSQVLGYSRPTPAQCQVHSDVSSGCDLDLDLIHSSHNEANASHDESLCCRVLPKNVFSMISSVDGWLLLQNKRRN